MEWVLVVILGLVTVWVANWIRKNNGGDGPPAAFV